MLHWSKKNGRIFLDKMVNTDYLTLKRLAWDRFDPEWTVQRAKKERYWDQKESEIKKIMSEEINKETENEKEVDSDNEHINEKEVEQEMMANEDFPEEWSFDVDEVENEFIEWWENPVEEENHTSNQKNEVFSIEELPDSFEKINQIATILRNYPWEISIYVTGQEKKINEEWLNLLKQLQNS